MEDRPITATPAPTPPAAPAPPAASPAYRFALAAAAWAHNTRCERVVLLDLRGRSPVTEFFLIATGTSARQMRTVADELAELGQREGFAAWQTSGYDSARWIVIDFVHVVAHIFDPESRNFYDLELLWGDCPRVDSRAELGLPAETVRLPAEIPVTEAPMLDADERDGGSSGDLEAKPALEMVNAVTIADEPLDEVGAGTVTEAPVARAGGRHSAAAARRSARPKVRAAKPKSRTARTKKTVPKIPAERPVKRKKAAGPRRSIAKKSAKRPAKKVAKKAAKRAPAKPAKKKTK